MSTVTIYGPAPSTYVRSARIFCEEKGVAYELNQEIDREGAEYKALHPFGRIPAFRHGEFTFHETDAIGRYIDRVFDGPALQPSDPKHLALMDKWLTAITDYFYQVAVREIIWQRFLVPMQGGQPDEEMIAAALPKLDHQLGVIAGDIGDSYLAGDTPSLADWVLVPIITYLKGCPEGEGAIAKQPAVGAWFGKLAARDSFAATMPPLPKAAE